MGCSDYVYLLRLLLAVALFAALAVARVIAIDANSGLAYQGLVLALVSGDIAPSGIG